MTSHRDIPALPDTQCNLSTKRVSIKKKKRVLDTSVLESFSALILI